MIEVFNRYGQKIEGRLIKENFILQEKFEPKGEGLFFVNIKSLQGQILETRKVIVNEK